MLKTKLKKETLETEIELLENHIKLKRQELRHSCTSLNDEYNEAGNTSAHRLTCSVDPSLNFKAKMNPPKTNCSIDQRNPFTYEEVS